MIDEENPYPVLTSRSRTMGRLFVEAAARAVQWHLKAHRNEWGSAMEGAEPWAVAVVQDALGRVRGLIALDELAEFDEALASVQHLPDAEAVWHLFQARRRDVRSLSAADGMPAACQCSPSHGADTCAIHAVWLPLLPARVT